MKKTIVDKIEHLDKALVRSEFKIEIYSIYILPSIRFLLTIHDLPKTYLEKLDTAVDQYLKKWAGLPQCATTSLLHFNKSLGIKNISSLYYECHVTSHCSTRLKGDKKVNLVLDNRLERESCNRKSRTVTVIAEETFKSALSDNLIQNEIPTNAADLTLSGPDPLTESVNNKFIDEVKKDAKTQLICQENQQISTLIHLSQTR